MLAVLKELQGKFS